jgi:hypothetical protein
LLCDENTSSMSRAAVMPSMISAAQSAAGVMSRGAIHVVTARASSRDTISKAHSWSGWE